MDRRQLTPKKQALLDELDRQASLHEGIENQKVKEAIVELLQDKPGQLLFRYFFKHMSPVGIPEMGLDVDTLRERLGFFRAARSIWEIVAAADPNMAAQLLTSIEKEKDNEREIREKILNERE